MHIHTHTSTCRRAWHNNLGGDCIASQYPKRFEHFEEKWLNDCGENIFQYFQNVPTEWNEIVSKIYDVCERILLRRR